MLRHLLGKEFMYYLHGGVGELEALRKPLQVTRASYERAQANLAPLSWREKLDPERKSVWFRTKQELYVPYWTLPEYRARELRDPLTKKSDLLYTPYWMTNKSRARLIQRPVLQIKPRSEVLYHLGTDEFDGLGKGFKPFKAVKRAVTFTKTSFQPKKILGAIASITTTVATGGLGPIIAPKIFSANSKTMQAVGIGIAGIALVAGAVVLGPAIAASLGPVLSSAAGLAGKAVTGLTTFMGAFNKLAPQKQQELGPQLTPQQVADIDAGRAQLTEQGVVYPPVQPPGSLMVQGQPVPQAPWQPAYDPNAFGPGVTKPVEAGMMGGLTPMTIGLMIGIPLIVQLLLKERK